MNFAKSALIHIALVALLIVLGTTVHRVVKPTYRSTVLVLPASLPVPTRRPIALRPVALLTSSAPTLLRASAASPEVAPQPVKLDASGSLALPQMTQRSVTAAPVARPVGFGQSTAVTGSSVVRSVTTGNFGTVAGTAEGHGEGRVVTVGFQQTVAAPVSVKAAEPAHKVPVILSEPAAIYSEAARAAHVEGTVDIRVKFKVDGTVEVLGIVNGLPGLNESALAVARGIRFIPGSSDFTTTVHVRFELS